MIIFTELYPSQGACYTDKITLYITDAVAGTKYEDVCISGIEVNTVEQLAAVE